MQDSSYIIGGSALLVAGLVGGVLAFCGDGTSDLPVYWKAPEFALVDQRGDTLRTTDLRGTVWVSSFIFTSCTGVCPLISARMARVRDTLAADGLLGTKARLVSISVDPARDTPAVLHEYAGRYGGSPPEAWAFLTGSPPERVRSLIQEGFRVAAVDPFAASSDTTAETTTGYQVQHSPRIMLVDPQGRVRGTYDATDADAVERVLGDLRALVE